MTQNDPSTESRLSGQEPGLGGGQLSPLTGYEPLLGGIRRVGPDFSRVLAIINEQDVQARRDMVESAVRLGQTDLYAGELAQVIPRRARVKSGSWRGAFTPGQRCRAMQILSQIGGTESVLPLLESLADDIYEVRQSAETALVSICSRLDLTHPKTRVVYEALVDSLRLLPLSARQVVAQILAAALPDLVLPLLLARGLTAPEWYARRDSAWTLGRLGDKRATLRLIDMLDDESPAVRASAAWALGQWQAPVAIEALSLHLDDRDEVVRAAIVEALGGQVGRLSAFDEALQPTLDLIVSCLQDADIAVKQTALETLDGLQQHLPEARLALKRAARRGSA